MEEDIGLNATMTDLTNKLWIYRPNQKLYLKTVEQVILFVF